MSEPLISRVYDLKISGYDESIKQVKALTAAFKAMDAQKEKLNQQLQSKLNIGDTEAVKLLTAEIKKLQTEMDALSKKKESSAKESALMAKAEKDLAAAELTRTKNIVDQNKESDRQTALQEKKSKQDAKTGEDLRILSGNYYQLLQAQKAANELYRLAQPNSPLFEQIKQGAVDAKKKVDDFNRSLSSDGTLVGEYSKGISNAFAKLGLSDVLKQQSDGIQRQLNALIEKNKILATQYRETSKIGGEGFAKIDTELKESIQLQQQMEANLKSIKVSSGGIGSEITGSLKAEFANLKTNIAQFAIGYVGFQAAVSAVTNVVNTNLNFEKKTNELSAITGIIGKDLDTLKQKALETSSVTRFSADQILEGFKLIANAKPELAGSVDSLNAVKDAAVQLAQASSSDLPTAVNGLLFTLNQFGAGADQAGKFVDALAAGAKFGAAEIPAISEAIKEFGTQAALSNVSIYESVGLVELLASKGIQGAEAGTKLRNVLLALDAAPALGRRALKELNKAGVDLKTLGDNTLPLEQRLTELAKVQDNNTALVKIFGKENFNAGQIVLKNIPAFVAFEKQVRNTGIAQEQAAINTDTASVKLAKLGNQIQNAFTSDNVVKVLGAIATGLSFILGLPFPVFITALITTIALTDTWVGSKLRLAAAFVLEKTAIVVETAQLIISNATKATATFLTNVYTVATIRSNTATGAAALAYRLLAGTIALITSPIGIIIGLVVGLTTIFGVMTSKANAGSSSIRDLAKANEELAVSTKINAEISDKVVKATEQQVAKIKELEAITTNLSLSDKTRRAALEELVKISPKYRDALQGEAIDVSKVKQITDEYIETLKKAALAKAAQSSLEEKTKIIFDAETKLGTITGTDKGGAVEFAKGLANGLFNIGDGTFQQQKAALQAKIEQAVIERDAIVKQFGDNADLIASIVNGPTPPTHPTPPVDPKAKTAEQIRDERIKIQDELFNIDKNNLQRKNLNEAKYATELNKLVQKYSDAKLQIVNENADKEQLRISELNLDKFNSTKETNEKLLTLETNQAEKQLQLKKEAAQNKFDFVNANPNSTNKQKYDAKINMDIALVQAQFKFNTDIDNIEKTYGKKSVENEKAREKTFQELFSTWIKDTIDGTKANYDEQLRLADEASRTQANIIKQNAASKTIDVLNNNSLGPNDKAKYLKQIEAEETRNLLKAEIEDAKESLKIKQRGLATEIEISDAKTKLKLAELALSKHVSESEQTYIEKFVGKLKDAYKNITNVFKGIKASQEDIDAAIGAAVQSISAAIEQSKQNFFNNQRANADAEKGAALARLDLQQQQLESTAQSENEKESIRRQFEEKRKQAEKKAGEEKKKIAQTELAINFAVAVVKTLAAYPFPFSLLPIAGLTLLYAAQKAQLNSQKFASGGYTGMGTVKDNTGHRVAGIVHNDEWVSPKWMVEHPTYGRVINQLENVRMKGFADGGFTGLGNFKLGDNLQAPVNVGSFLNKDSKDQINKLTQLVNTTNDNVNKVTDSVNNVSKRIDNIKVSVVAKEVDNQNTIDKKAIAKGRI